MKKIIYVILCLFCLFITACSISDKDIKDANVVCKQNGGVNMIYVDYLFNGINEVVCNNGATFDRRNTKKFIKHIKKLDNSK